MNSDGRISKRMQRDAAAVSTVRGRRRFGSFADHQQLAEEAPLMRKPLGGSGEYSVLLATHYLIRHQGEEDGKC